MKTKTAVLVSLACSVVAGQSHAADPVVYKQPYANYEDTTWDSFVTPDTTSVTTYDSFKLDSSGRVTAVQWQGDYIDHNNLYNNPTAPDATSFTISFWTDNNGKPGTQIYTQTLPISACAQTSLGTVPFNAFNDPTTHQISFYTYRAALPTAFDATAGATYWVSIVATCTQNTPIWSWYASSADGDTTCIQDIPGNRLTRDGDRAFALEGLPSFFTGESALSNGVYYLTFPNGNYFGYYAYLSDPRYLYHFDLGYEYVFDANDANDGKQGVYLYDFASRDFFYTSPSFPFPYLYDFNLRSVVYYYPDPNNVGRYNTNGTRYFYVFNTGQIISK